MNSEEHQILDPKDFETRAEALDAEKAKRREKKAPEHASKKVHYVFRDRVTTASHPRATQRVDYHDRHYRKAEGMTPRQFKKMQKRLRAESKRALRFFETTEYDQ